MDKKSPTLIERTKSYLKERKKWIQADKPLRTQSKVNDIFIKYCQPCQYYNGSSCNICGCFINTRMVVNKLVWATTQCPGTPPKWTEEVKELTKKIVDKRGNKITPSSPTQGRRRCCG